MLQLLRTTSDNRDFINLIKELDAYLKITDGDEHEFYNQFNGIESLKNVIIAYDNNEAVGCGAFKEYTDDSVEIKRMYTKPSVRNEGLATQILTSLEEWARELNFSFCILETGIRQKEAVEFYKKNNYHTIENYGQYKTMTNSLCFKKSI